MALKLSDIPRLISVVVDTMESKATLDKIGTDLVKRIKTRTRLGKGVQKNLEPAQSLPKLKSTTIKERKRLKKKGSLTGPRAQPAKSGLNRTGQLLDSVKHKAKKGQLDIELDNNTAKRKAQDLIKQDKDYTFMNISQPEFKATLRTLQEILKKKIKSVFK